MMSWMGGEGERNTRGTRGKSEILREMEEERNLHMTMGADEYVTYDDRDCYDECHERKNGATGAKGR
eukprot:6181087-Pleurochrysis_carterae.AAC.4